MLETLRKVADFLNGATVYLAACAGCGSACGIIADLAGRSILLWWFFGFFLPAAPLYFWFASERLIRRRLVWYKSMAEEKLITAQQFSHLRKTLLRWYAIRQFGREALDLPMTDETDA